MKPETSRCRRVAQFVSGAWLVKTLQLTGPSVTLAVPVMLALAATYNGAPSRTGVRYPALALAVVASSALGLAAAMIAEAWLSCPATLEQRVGETGLLKGFRERDQASGGGTGLANIRARLTGMYGAAGRLSLALNQPRGVVATIAVPLALSPVPRAASL